MKLLTKEMCKMPGSIVHLLVQKNLGPYLSELGGREYANILKEDPFSPYTGFGSVGPDFLFFSFKEYGKPLQDFVHFTFQAYDALEPLITFYNMHIKPVEDAVEDVENWVDEKLFDGILQDLKNTASTLTSAALTAIVENVTDFFDFFNFFYPKVQEGAPEDEWYWFDFLHYRRTGRFCSNMWEIAQGDHDLMRYCLGYASHIGTDVVGHPYVNAIVGGPYRTHWHRHKLVENWIDAYTIDFCSDQMEREIKQGLRLQGEDKFNSKSISGSYLSRLCEFDEKKLPEKLGNMILTALDKTYNDIPHPPELNFGDLDDTYRLWLLWFERATKIGSAVKPKPVEPPWEIITDLLKDYQSGLPTPPSIPIGGKSGFNAKKIFESIHEFVKYLGEVILYTIDWLINHLTEIVSLGYKVGLRTVKYFLYLIHKGIYEFYDNSRFKLVLGGYLFPESEDLQKQPWGRALLNTSYVGLTGGGQADFTKYPLKQEFHDFFTPEHHLKYPETFQENPYTEPAPMPFYNEYPEKFIFGWSKTEGIETLYNCITPYGENEKSTHFVDSKTWDEIQLGSAIRCSTDLILKRMDNIPNFNLDGDRGYGWKTWRANTSDINNTSTVDVTYIDSKEGKND